MTETQELMFETLGKIQGDISFLKDGHRELRQDIGSLRGHIHVMQGNINNLQYVNMQILDRLERIENRIELRELAESQARFEPQP